MKYLQTVLIANIMALTVTAAAQEASGPRRATRQTTLLNAKNMVLTTTKGTTY